MNPSSRVVVLSRRSAERRVWQASQYEFEDIIGEVDDAEILAPPALPAKQARTLGLRNRAAYRLGQAPRAAMRLPAEGRDSELFFTVVASPSELDVLPVARGHISRARRRVAFIVEMYETQIESSIPLLKQLRGFDHVFSFTRRVIPAITEITGVPCSYLPTGVDAELFVPAAPDTTRFIDVMSYGRRLPQTHAALRDAAAAGRLSYFYDTVAGAFDVSDHRDHRAALAASLQRSRYTVVYKNNDEPSRVSRTAGEETLTNRWFEATAAGATVLGSVPDVEDFPANFDWPDAIVPIPAPAPGVESAIAALDADPARLERARLAGRLAALRRHDWAHRWQEVLDAVGLEATPFLGARLQRLEARAQEIERAALLTPDVLAG